MASTAHRLRLGALAAAAALALTGLAAAAPASAAEGDAPVIALDQTTFAAGDWAGGFDVTGSGFDPSVPVAEVSIGANGENGGGQLWSAEVAVAADGTIDEHLVPDQSTQAPDENGYPKYNVNASQHLGETWLFSNSVALTITEGVSAAAPEEASADQLAGGIAVQFSGFAGGESVQYTAVLHHWNEADEVDEIVDQAEGAVTADGAGSGGFTVALAGAQEGDYVVIDLVGTESMRLGSAWTSVVAADVAPPAPVDPAPAPAVDAAAPAAATGPQLAETGPDLGIGLAAMALIALGAGVVVMRRRTAATR
ncbi:hypothetical protein BJ978_000901 [Agromyces terreus]|uniref:LPXTG cell wall anchor domain-containing protein n=1 Tax=Agromyces terreus TaxID=424795 RepID=A0A9X2KBJ4_9MICO|nr:hypothetical protein [Agromyces terreus]MCP2370225.1 hypothetical protein [Agromyces terreus]